MCLRWRGDWGGVGGGGRVREVRGAVFSGRRWGGGGGPGRNQDGKSPDHVRRRDGFCDKYVGRYSIFD